MTIGASRGPEHDSFPLNITMEDIASLVGELTGKDAVLEDVRQEMRGVKMFWRGQSWQTFWKQQAP